MDINDYSIKKVRLGNGIHIAFSNGDLEMRYNREIPGRIVEFKNAKWQFDPRNYPHPVSNILIRDGYEGDFEELILVESGELLTKRPNGLTITYFSNGDKKAHLKGAALEQYGYSPDYEMAVIFRANGDVEYYVGDGHRETKYANGDIESVFSNGNQCIKIFKSRSEKHKEKSYAEIPFQYLVNNEEVLGGSIPFKEGSQPSDRELFSLVQSTIEYASIKTEKDKFGLILKKEKDILAGSKTEELADLLKMAIAKKTEKPSTHHLRLLQDGEEELTGGDRIMRYEKDGKWYVKISFANGDEETRSPDGKVRMKYHDGTLITRMSLPRSPRYLTIKHSDVATDYFLSHEGWHIYLPNGDHEMHFQEGRFARRKNGDMEHYRADGILKTRIWYSQSQKGTNDQGNTVYATPIEMRNEQGEVLLQGLTVHRNPGESYYNLDPSAEKLKATLLTEEQRSVFPKNVIKFSGKVTPVQPSPLPTV